MHRPDFGEPTYSQYLQSSPTSTAKLKLGFTAAIRGFYFAIKTPELRRVYLHMILVLYVLTIVFSSGLITALWVLMPIPEDALWWLSLGIWVIRILGSLAALLLAPLLALWILNVAFPSLGERVFFTSLRMLAPELAIELEAKPGTSNAASIGVSLRRFMYFFGLTCIIFVFSWIPLLAPILQLWVTAQALSWELLDPWFDKRGLSYAEQKNYVKKHRQLLSGFGLAYSLVLAIPFVGPLCFAMAQASTAFLLVKELEPIPCSQAETNAHVAKYPLN